MAVRVRAVMQIDSGLLKQAEVMAPRIMRRVIKKAAKHALARIKGGGPRPAPIRTGRLRRSYGMTITHGGLRILIASDPSIAPYAGFVEFGTRNMSARPHFRPAIRAARKMVRREANKQLAAGFAGL